MIQHQMKTYMFCFESFYMAPNMTALRKRTILNIHIAMSNKT